MLPGNKRLNLKNSFGEIASGKKANTPSLRLMYKFTNSSTPLVGIALSKAYFKKAFQRNRARRLVSKTLENYYPTLPKGLNLVIIPKAEVLEKTPDDLFKELKDVQYSS